MAIKKLLPSLFDIGDASDGEVFRVSSGTLKKTGSGMVFKDNGRMGIGTASPDRILDVNGGTGSYLMQLHNTTAGGEFLEMIGDAGNPVWQFQSGGTGGEGLINGYNDNVQKVQIAADTDHPTYFLASNVGIGAATPGQKLSVEGAGTANENVVRFNNQGNYASRIWLRNSGSSAYISQAGGTADTLATGLIGGSLSIGHSGGGGMQWWTYNGGAGNIVRMSLADNGNLGIGTTAPSQKLHVKGAGVALFESTATNAWIRLKGSTTYSWQIGATNYGLQFYNDETSAYRVVFKKDGNVGIGTISPTEKLHIAGTEAVIKLVDTAATSAGYVDFDGTALQLNTNRNPNTGAFADTGKSHASIIMSGAAGGSHILFYTKDSNNATGTARMKIAANGYINMDGASQVRLTLGSQGTAGNNDSNWIRGNGTSLGFNAAGGYTAWEVSGTEKMRIAPDGNVGIGTTTPAGLLTVKRNDTATGGQLVVEQDGSGDATLRWLLTNTQSWMAGIDNSDGDKFKISSDGTGVETATQLTIQSDGKVGIGTTAPALKLHIVDSSGTTYNSAAMAGGQLKIYNDVGSNMYGFTGLRIDSRTSGGNDGEGWIGLAHEGSNYADMVFGVRDSSTGVASEKMRITKVGNVGIGTTSPGSYKLYVNGATRINGAFSTTGSLTGTTAVFSGHLTTDQVIIKHDYSVQYFQKADATMLGYLLMRDNGANYLATTSGQDFGIVEGNTERMRIKTSTGFVGIGTDSPDRNLHIWKATAGSVTASSDAQLVVENSAVAAINLLSGSTSHGQILFGDAADNDDGQFGYDQAVRGFYWKTAGVNTKRMFISSVGDVGIGTTAPNTYGYSTATVLTISDPTNHANNRGILELESTKTTPADGDYLGGIAFISKNNTSGKRCANIRARASGSTAAHFGGKLEFQTKADNGAEATRLTISRDGLATFANDVVVTGNFTVNGTTTTIVSTNLLIDDPLMLLARIQSGTPTKDSGLIIERGSSTNVGMIWDESADEFAFINTTDTATTAGNVTIASYAPLHTGYITATGSIETTSVFTAGSSSSSYAINVKRGSGGDPYIRWSSSSAELGRLACGTGGFVLNSPTSVEGALTGTSATFTGVITADAGLVLNDNDKIKLGTGGDLEIFFDGTTSHIRNHVGGLIAIRSSEDVLIQTNASSGGATDAFKCFSNGTSQLYGALTGTSAAFSGAVGMAALTATSATINGGLTVNVDASSNSNSSLEVVDAGTNAIMVRAKTGDELYLSSNAGVGGYLRLLSAGGIDVSGGGTFSGDVSVGDQLAVGATSAATYEKLLVKEGGSVTYSHANNRHGAIVATTGSGAFALNSNWVNNWHKIGGLFVSSEITNNYANYGIVAIAQSNNGSAWGGSFSAEDVHASGTAYGVYIKKVTANTRYGIYDASGAPWYTGGAATFGGNVTLATGGSDAAPRLAFGDGNTGFFELGDNDLYVTVGGTRSFIFEENSFYGANATAAKMRGNVAAAANTASFCFNSDSDTGIGRAAADKLSLVAGGVGTVTVTPTAVGIGVTPKAWTLFKPIQAGLASAFTGRGDVNQTDVTTNWYYDGTEKRIRVGYAQRFVVNSTGGFDFYTAGTAAADSTIAFGTAKVSISNAGLATFTQGISVQGNNLFLPTAATIEWGTAWNTGQLTFQNGSSIAAILAATALTVYVPIVSEAGITIANDTPKLSIKDTNYSNNTFDIDFNGGVSGFFTSNANTYFSFKGGGNEFARIGGDGNDHTFFATRGTGNVGIGTSAPAARLHVPSSNGVKVTKFGDDITSHYKLTGNADHTLTLTCGSYYQAEVIITAHQTNGGNSNNLYIRGIWSNNHTSHHWDEIENVGSLTNSSFTFTIGQNGSTTNTGELKIVHDYVSGSFTSMTVRVVEHFGSEAHAYVIS